MLGRKERRYGGAGVSENDRRELAACDALLAALKIARSSWRNRSSQISTYPTCRSWPVIPRWAHRNAAVNSATNSSAA